MTDEISKEITLEDRLKFFEVEVKDYFEYDYKNENGNEDTREACLIRGGYRIALQAKECINRQKAEIERLKKNIDGLNIFTTNHMKVIRLQAIKEFVEKLTDKISVYSKYVDVDGIVILNRIFRMIEDIAKEMTEENNEH